ncbi:MAG: hypothetical protein ACOVNU_09860 [Candidatus Kapaibacteriota bacterium]
MNEDYNYKLYSKVEKELIEKNYKKICQDLAYSRLVHRYESWTKGGNNILLQVFTNNYVAIYKDFENI